jgi:hypothetical protein
MANPVTVTVTSEVLGTGIVAPYNPEQGLLVRRPMPGRPGQLVLYQVPLYGVRIEGARTYKAIRFAVRNTGATPTTRGCDTGLSYARTCKPSWVPNYSPHSFDGMHVGLPLPHPALAGRIGHSQGRSVESILICGGDEAQRRSDARVIPWSRLDRERWGAPNRPVP